MSAASTEIIRPLVEQHADEVSTLHAIRRHLTGSPHVSLVDLLKLDARIEAHVDGLLAAGDAAWPICDVLLEAASGEALFANAVVALMAAQDGRLGRLLAIASSAGELMSGLIAAFGWTAPEYLRGVVAKLLRSDDAVYRRVGVAACAIHRVDPGVTTRLHDPDPAVRARVLRTIGEIGAHAMVSTCWRAAADDDPDCRFWAVWSAVLLGDRQNALAALTDAAFGGGPEQTRALQLSLQAIDLTTGHELLRTHASDSGELRLLLKGAGLLGDPRYIPFLIRHMSEDGLARLSGESFSLITGLDLRRPSFERPQPDSFEMGPNDDPEDHRVAMDEDEGLPWPDHDKVQTWWKQHGERFTAGARYFMGMPPTRAHCIEVLRNGYQRQRVAAAYQLCLLNPGTPLFEWRAPARRQQTALAGMDELG